MWHCCDTLFTYLTRQVKKNQKKNQWDKLVFKYVYFSYNRTIVLFVFVIDLFYFVFNATFSNSSVISWRPVLVMEEAGVPGENQRPWESN